MSEYANTLPDIERKRYIDKLSSLGFDNLCEDDPYLPEKKVDKYSWIDDVTKWPNLEFGALLMYLVESPGPFTMQKMCSYRSLEAHEFYRSGWVQTCLYKRSQRPGCCVIKARVCRSQAITEKPYYAWVGIEEKDDFGTVVCGHCTCMAGLGEVCSHVAAILFKVEAACKLQYNRISCTSVPCQWNQHYSSKKLDAVPLEEIQFEKPHPKRKKCSKKSNKKLRKPADATKFLNELREINPRAVIFTVLNPNIRQIPQTTEFPLPLMNLRDTKYDQLSVDDLKEACDNVFEALSVTESQALALENATTKQSKCKTWFDSRQGRLTASNFHDAIHMQPESKSVIKKIMNMAKPFSSKFTQWGIDHEGKAKAAYHESAKEMHDDFALRDSGFVVNPKIPHLGASPDGVINCKCCGKGIIEVKCTHKFNSVHPCFVKDKNFSVMPHVSSGNMCGNFLKHSNRYYTQVQGKWVSVMCNIVISSLGLRQACTSRELHLMLTCSPKCYINYRVCSRKQYCPEY